MPGVERGGLRACGSCGGPMRGRRNQCAACRRKLFDERRARETREALAWEARYKGRAARPCARCGKATALGGQAAGPPAEPPAPFIKWKRAAQALAAVAAAAERVRGILDGGPLCPACAARDIAEMRQLRNALFLHSRLARGECPRCGGALAPGRTSCAECLERSRRPKKPPAAVKTCACGARMYGLSRRCPACSREATRRRSVERELERRAERAAAGKCLKCESGERRPGSTLCVICSEKGVDRMRDIRTKRLAAGLCGACGKARGPGASKTMCGDCLARMNARCRALQAKKKGQADDQNSDA